MLLTNTFHHRRQASAAVLAWRCKKETIEATARNIHLEGRKAPPGDALYSDSIVGRRLCDKIISRPAGSGTQQQSPPA
jgi:hypothetical protein